MIAIEILKALKTKKPLPESTEKSFSLVSPRLKALKGLHTSSNFLEQTTQLNFKIQKKKYFFKSIGDHNHLYF